MTIDDKIRNKKLQYDINREAAKISALSSDTITNQKERLEALTNKDVHKSIYGQIFDKLVKNCFSK